MRYTVNLVKDALDDAGVARRLALYGGEEWPAEKRAEFRAEQCGAVRHSEGSSDHREHLGRPLAWAEGRTRAEGDGCFGWRVEVDEVDADLVHVVPGGPTSEGWALWSDGAVTGARYLSPEGAATRDPGMSALAAEIVTEMRGSDSSCPEMGWRALVDRLGGELVRDEVVGKEPTRPWGYQGAEVRRIETTRGETWVWSVGHAEGYLYEVAATRAELEAIVAEVRGGAEQD